MRPDPQPWGPVASGGGRPPGRPLLVSTAVVVTVALLAAVGLAGLLYLRADGALTRRPVEGLTGDDEREVASSEATSFLVVGSDRRSDAQDLEGVATGDVDGQRGDAIFYVTVTPERDELSVVSLPRDLVIEQDGRPTRLADAYAGGAGELVATVRDVFGLPVHHYAEVTFAGFLDAVDTLGGVDLCLEEDLVDPDAGADLRAGCQRLDPRQALAFVRSREGRRSDLERIDRQQRFLRATLDELTERRLLADVPRLFDLVEDVAGSVTVDDRLETRQLLGLADELRDVVDGQVPMASIPVHATRLESGREVLVPYGPGTRALLEELRSGDAAPDAGTAEERAATTVALWTGDREEAVRVVGSTLLYGGFGDRRVAGPGPAELDPGSTTTVYARPDRRAPARRVAALLGAPVRDLPSGAPAPGDADAVVAVGRDARPVAGPAASRDAGSSSTAALLELRPGP